MDINELRRKTQLKHFNYVVGGVWIVVVIGLLVGYAFSLDKFLAYVQDSSNANLQWWTELTWPLLLIAPIAIIVSLQVLYTKLAKHTAKKIFGGE